jgi:hypothetical protein
LDSDNVVKFGIVVGYLKGDQLLPELASAGLTGRCAVLLPSYQAGNVDADFDCHLYMDIVGTAFRTVLADAARVAFAEGTIRDAGGVEELNSLFMCQAEQREPFAIAAFFKGGKLRAALISEPYALVGGPAPYHDTYCQSFFATPQDVASFVDELQKRLGTRMTDRFEGVSLPPQSIWGTLVALWRMVRATGQQRRHERLVAGVLLERSSRSKGRQPR